VIGAGGLTWRAVSQGVFAAGTGPAYAAWDQWNPPGHAPLNLVRAAVLAASAHNAQPWLFAVTPARIDLFTVPSRNIGTIDPLQREMHISLGCALENLVLAGPPHGLATTVTLLPDPADPAHVARVASDRYAGMVPAVWLIARGFRSSAPQPGDPLEKWSGGDGSSPRMASAGAARAGGTSSRRSWDPASRERRRVRGHGDPSGPACACAGDLGGTVTTKAHDTAVDSSGGARHRSDWLCPGGLPGHGRGPGSSTTRGRWSLRAKAGPSRASLDHAGCSTCRPAARSGNRVPFGNRLAPHDMPTMKTFPQASA